MGTSTELLAHYLLTPIVFTGEMQDYIMALGLVVVILLTILKVYYIFFNRSRLTKKNSDRHYW